MFRIMSMTLRNINLQKEIFHHYDFPVYTTSKYRDPKLDTYRRITLILDHLFCSDDQRKQLKRLKKSKRNFTRQTRNQSVSEQSKSAIADHALHINTLLIGKMPKSLQRSVSQMCAISKKPSGSDGCTQHDEERRGGPLSK